MYYITDADDQYQYQTAAVSYFLQIADFIGLPVILWSADMTGLPSVSNRNNIHVGKFALCVLGRTWAVQAGLGDICPSCALGPAPPPSAAPYIPRYQGHNMPCCHLLCPHAIGSAPTLPPHRKIPGAAHGRGKAQAVLQDVLYVTYWSTFCRSKVAARCCRRYGA